MIVSFPKIWAIGTPQVDGRLFTGPVEITEKIDGSQFNFGKDPEERWIMRSKGADQAGGTPDKLFRPVVDWAMSVVDHVPPGMMFHGETLCAPRHNTLEYGRVPKGHFMLYGISYAEGKFEYDFTNLVLWADRLGCETVPLWGRYNMEGLTEEMLGEFLSRESALGKVKPEGFVIKNYAESYLLGGQYIPLLAGKYVTEAFKEQHKIEWKTGADVMELMKQSFKTEARWHKAVQHLRERGELALEPKDIGPLMKELNEDFLTECEEDVKARLWNHYKKDFCRVITGGFPEWYKTQLATGAFQ